jgi:NAD(P)-dependent dehydrogenase (short-subunit alcohol dehydrogenase family)
MVDIKGKKVLITGGAKRIGRQLALAAAKAGADVIIHYGRSQSAAEELAAQIKQMDCDAEIVQADFADPENAIHKLEQVFTANDIFTLVNNASIFEPIKFADTSLKSWHTHMDVNLTVPFLLSQAFSKSLGKRPGRIINLLDWRALRPGIDHFPYTISKAALASMTESLARILAPNIQVNGLALGAILPPTDGNSSDGIIKDVPVGRWAQMDELVEAFMFLLTGPEYVTGEIIHLDGGRHLV